MEAREGMGWFLGGELLRLSLNTLAVDSPSGVLTAVVPDPGSGSERFTKSM